MDNIETTTLTMKFYDYRGSQKFLIAAHLNPKFIPRVGEWVRLSENGIAGLVQSVMWLPFCREVEIILE
jgi:hypothetical protein